MRLLERAARTTPGRGRDARAPAAARSVRPGWRWHLVPIVGLMLFAAWARRDLLGPSSLWLDDAWSALVGRAEGLGEVLRIGQASPGFALLLRWQLASVPFTETAAQTPAFVAGAVGPALTYLAAVRLRFRWPAALVAGVLLAASPTHIAYSARVKTFTLDACIAALVVILAASTIARPASRARWTALAIGSSVAVAMSGLTAPVAGAAMLAAVVAALRARPLVWRVPAIAVGASAVAVGLWTGFVIRPLVTEVLRAYWSDHYLPLDGRAFGSVAHGLVRIAEGFSRFPAAPLLAVAALGVALLLLARRVEHAVLLGAPVALLAVMAFLRLAPFGGGRTDVVLYPVVALLVAAALSELARLLARPLGARPTAVAGVAAAVIVAGLSTRVAPSPRTYPAEDVAPLVAYVERQALPWDGILLYPPTRFPFALYTSSPVEVIPVGLDAVPFNVVVLNANVHALVEEREVPERYRPQIAALADRYRRIWVVASHIRSDLGVIQRLLIELGYQPLQSESRRGASVTLWERLSS